LAVAARALASESGIARLGVWHDTWRRFRRSTSAMVGLVLVAVLVVAAIAAPVLSGHVDPLAQNLGATTLPPSLYHIAGTDKLGRDIYVRLLAGARLSLEIGFVSVAIGLVKSGLREVSCGYEADYVQTEPGRGKQTNIIGNHLALVEEGRAGPAYAINDHKGDTKGAQIMKKETIAEKLKAIFARTADEAVKALDEAEPKKEEEKSKDSASYDELVEMVKDLGEKIASLGQPNLAKPKDEMEPKVEKEEKAGDEGEEEPSADEEVAASVEERLKALELTVAKIMEAESAEAEAMEDEEGEEEMMEDEDMPEVTGDTRARAEILAPGIKVTKDVKQQALKAAYGTKEGKKVIDAISGGKLTLDSADRVNTLFIAASELLKASRSNELSKSKQVRDTETSESPKHMTPERMNELNAARYKTN